MKYYGHDRSSPPVLAPASGQHVGLVVVEDPVVVGGLAATAAAPVVSFCWNLTASWQDSSWSSAWEDWDAIAAEMVELFGWRTALFF